MFIAALFTIVMTWKQHKCPSTDKWKKGVVRECMLSHFSCVQLFAILWTVARQALLFMGFSRKEYWSGLPCLSPGDLPDPGIEPGSPALLADSLLSESPGKSSFNQLYPSKYCDIHPLKEYTLCIRNYSCYYEGYKYKICNACLRKAWWWKLTRIILVYLTLLNPRLEHVFNFGHYQKV